MWPKPDIPPLPKPKPLKIWNWICLAIFIYSCVILMTVFICPKLLQIQTTNLGLFIIQSVITLIIMAMCFAVRFIIYGFAEEKQKILAEQEKAFHRYWQDWSMQSLVVLKSFIVTSNHFNVDTLIFDASNIDSLRHKVLAFDEVDDRLYIQFFEDIAFSLRSYENLIPPNATLTILVQGQEIRSPLFEKNLLNSLSIADLSFSVTIEYIHRSQEQTVIIDTLIDKQENTFYLLITDCTLNKDSSAFLSALLLGHKTIDTVPHESNILRTMETTLEEFCFAIEQIKEIQPAFSETKAIWLGKMDKVYDKELHVLLIMTLKPDDFPDIYRLSTYIGMVTHDLSYEAQLIFASQLAKKTQKTQLVVGNQFDKFLFTVISPPSIGEKVT